MSVRIRMTRTGRTNRTFWRIGVYKSTTRRDGRSLELLGSYDPRVADSAKKVVVNKERLDYWIGKGALPSDALKKLLKAAGAL